MKYLRWFYIAVQFVMLAVSIPKVATLFHAYNPDPIGGTFAGLDLTSWMVGIAIDCCAAVTTLAALHKFEATRSRLGLYAPALIILCCTGLSVIANYEDAATLAPSQYAHVALFTHPALLINPLLISAPPMLVFLLILLVPSVLAEPKLRTAEEIEAATQEQELLIAAKGRLKRAQAEENARVRQTRVRGFMATVDAIAPEPDISPLSNRGNGVDIAPNIAPTVDADPGPEDDPEPPDDPPPTPPQLSLIPMPAVKMTKAMWQAMPLQERVIKSGVIMPQEVADVLGISVAQARAITKDVTGNIRVSGRTGVSYSALIDSLYDQDSYEQAHKLEDALGLREEDDA